MSLTDVDKNGGRRTKPTLNTSDTINVDAVKAHATEGIAYRSEDATGAPRVIQRDDQIIIHDGANNKAIFGRDAYGEYVVMVAKDGFDVLTTDYENLIFNSGNNLFKILDTGVISISHVHTTNSAKTTTVAHGQASRPTVICFANNLVAPGVPGTPSYQMPFIYPAVSGGNLVIGTLLQAYVDDTYLTIYSWENAATTITADVRYYILQETASD